MTGRRTLPNVVQQFRSLNRRGERIGVRDGFPREFADQRYSIFHKRGGLNNHFQGVQRLGNVLLVTGSYPYRGKRADLLVMRLGSRSADSGPWGSNLMRRRDPSEQDRLVAYFPIDKQYWHPGGFSLLDSTAVIPLENSKKQSKIVFVDLANPEHPKLIDGSTIERPEWKAGACAITPLPDGGTLIAVWTDSDKPPPGEETAPFHLDLYRSPAVTPSDHELIGQFFPLEDHDFHRKFQSMDFIWDEKRGRGARSGDKRLFLIAFENTSEAQPDPLNPGENVALLFEVDLAALPLGTAGRPEPLHLDTGFLTPVGDPVLFETSGNWCNMDAGSCAYVDSGQQLIVYSVYHFMAPIRGASVVADLIVKALEFRATQFASTITEIEDAWVDLYEEPGMQGRRLALLGPFNSSIEDTSNGWADDKRFDVTSSIRCQLPKNRAFVLYPQKRFRGEPSFVIGGDGEVTEIDVLANGFGGQFLSCHLQPESVAVTLPGAIIV